MRKLCEPSSTVTTCFRLIENKGGIDGATICGGHGSCATCPIAEALSKLAAYEDTGLSPEMVQRLILQSQTNQKLKANLICQVTKLQQTLRERDEELAELKKKVDGPTNKLSLEDRVSRLETQVGYCMMLKSQYYHPLL